MPTIVAGNTYDINDAVLIEVTITDVDNAVTTPATLQLEILEPDSTTVTKNIGDLSSPSTGVYQFIYTVTQAGKHKYRWTSTAPNVVEEHAFTVPPSQVG